MLDDEKFSNIEKLNDALWPHWRALWRVCARGHYAVHRMPLREKAGQRRQVTKISSCPFSRGLPSFEEGGYRLELVATKAMSSR